MHAINTLFKIAFCAVAVSAIALPQEESNNDNSENELTVAQAQSQCKGKQGQEQASCCNKVSNDQSLIPILSDLELLGGTCSDIAVNLGVLGAAQSDQAKKVCTNAVACCPSGTDGSSSNCALLN